MQAILEIGRKADRANLQIKVEKRPDGDFNPRSGFACFTPGIYVYARSAPNFFWTALAAQKGARCEFAGE